MVIKAVVIVAIMLAAGALVARSSEMRGSYSSSSAATVNSNNSSAARKVLASPDRRLPANEHIVVSNWLSHTKAVRQELIAAGNTPAARECPFSHIYRASAQCLDFDRFGDIVRGNVRGRYAGIL